jgi:hypothetical protein
MPPGVNVPVYFTIQLGGGYLWVDTASGSKGGWLIPPSGAERVCVFRSEPAVSMAIRKLEEERRSSTARNSRFLYTLLLYIHKI